MANSAILATDSAIRAQHVNSKADRPPLTEQQTKDVEALETIRVNLVRLHNLPRSERWPGFNQSKEETFVRARNLVHHLSLLTPVATEEVDYAAVIDALSNAEEIVRREIDAEGRALMKAALADKMSKKHGVSFGPMVIDLQLKQEAHMHALIEAQTNAIEKDTDDLEKLRKALAQLHALHKKEAGVNINGETPEVIAKVKELLDAVYAIDPLIWKDGGYNFDEHSFQAVVENMNGKVQAISRLINAKYLTIEQKTQLRNLLNNCMADVMRKVLREIEKIQDNTNAKRG